MTDDPKGQDELHPECPSDMYPFDEVISAPKASKYHREIRPGVWVEVYDVLTAWAVTNPALQHLIKKALQPGSRGHKTLEQDMADIVASAKRAQELES
jgi:ABC-type glycerol-3-phosphate transport system substrate-binding protein